MKLRDARCVVAVNRFTRARDALSRIIRKEPPETYAVWSDEGTSPDARALRLAADGLAGGPIEDDLRHASAVVWCLEFKATQLSPLDHEARTIAWARAAVATCKRFNSSVRFCFLSSASAKGRDASGVGSVLRAAEAIVADGLRDVYILRPGHVRVRSEVPRGDLDFGVLTPTLERLSTSIVVSDVVLATACLRVAEHGADQRVLDTSAIWALAADAMPFVG